MFEIFMAIFALLCINGIVIFIWNLFAMEKFKKALIAEAEQKKFSVVITVRPKTVEQYRLNPDRGTFFHYFRLLEEFGTLSLSGKMQTTSTEIAAIKLAVSNLYFTLYKQEHKKRVYITLGLWLLMLPISFWLIVVGAAFFMIAMTIQGKNLTRFETLVNHYYSPQSAPNALSSTAATPISLAAEIQKLKEMRMKGVISDAEFVQLKKKLICV